MYTLARPAPETVSSYNFSCVPAQGMDVAFLGSPNFATLDTIGTDGTHDFRRAAMITRPFGSIEVFNMSPEVWFDLPTATLRSLTFTLRDRNNWVLSLVQNVTFVLTID